MSCNRKYRRWTSHFSIAVCSRISFIHYMNEQPYRLTRHEFLKLISLMPLGIYLRPLLKLVKRAKDPNAKNTPALAPGASVIILVFDALSQQHVSLYGYPRPTTPNLDAFAEKATVYHNHFSTGTFTVPGTSSILTGMHPWSHRAFQLGGGIAPAHVDHTIFAALSSTHSTLAYAQNKFADQILYQAEENLDRHIHSWSFNREYASLYGAAVFDKDVRMAYAGLEDNLIQKGIGDDASLFFGPLYRLHMLWDRMQNRKKYRANYPHGLPDAMSEFFTFPDVIDGAIHLLQGIQEPTLAYLHFFPPHEPSAPTAAFFNRFENDGLKPPAKPIHDLSGTKYEPAKLKDERRFYDEYIASWDDEVGRLFKFIIDSGLVENSYILITSDHGQLFERGELGHWTSLIYNPIIHVPLIIRSPNQITRHDVHASTSSVDLLPTIAQLTGNPIPVWAEGKLLPNFGGEEEEGRSVFSMDAKSDSAFAPLRNYSMSLMRNRHRLTYYSYPEYDYERYEFYDLDADPDELKDLYSAQPSLAKAMQDELRQKISEVNRPFQKNGL